MNSKVQRDARRPCTSVRDRIRTIRASREITPETAKNRGVQDFSSDMCDRCPTETMRRCDSCLARQGPKHDAGDPDGVRQAKRPVTLSHRDSSRMPDCRNRVRKAAEHAADTVTRCLGAKAGTRSTRHADNPLLVAWNLRPHADARRPGGPTDDSAIPQNRPLQEQELP